MEQKRRRLIGWIVSALPLLFLVVGAVPKFFPGYATQFGTMFPSFWPSWVFGIVLIAAIGMYLYPKTQVVGAALATGYLGGAAALAWHTMGGVLAAAPVFLAIALLWMGVTLLRPSLLKESKE